MMELSEEQQIVANAVLADVKKKNKQYVTLSGFGGTGKSTIIQYLAQNHLYNWAFCAYTGKAVSVLKKKQVDLAQTIHSLIYKPMRDGVGNLILNKDGNPIFVLSDSLLASGIIVDEASMVSKDIFEDLLSFNLPIIFVGDHGQLEPVGSSFNLMENPDYKLETIHRNAGEIAHFCNYIREGNNPASFQYQYNAKKVKFVSKWKAPNHYDSVDQIICAFNKTRVKINKDIRKEKGYDSPTPITGEKVMCLKNNKQSGLFNGMQGTCKILPGFRNKMNFNCEDLNFNVDVFYDPSMFNKEKYEIGFRVDDPDCFDYCYAISCHKSQGSEWDNGMVIEERCQNWTHSKWVYTAASRFKKSIIWAS